MIAAQNWVGEAQMKIERMSIPEPNSGCWLWEGNVARERKPYGRVRFQKRTWAAHRLSYTAYKGPIPGSLWVLHKCDNPACVNPDHLFLGDSDTNVEDRDRKGRQSQGFKHPNSKFTLADINYIRRSRARTLTLATRFSVQWDVIDSIKKGKSYKSVPFILHPEKDGE